MAAWVRAKAMLTMTSPLGPDVLIPTSLTAQEGISQTFTFEVDVVSQQSVIDHDKLLHQPVCIVLQDNGQPIRYFHGIVQTLTSHGSLRGQSQDEFYAYKLVVVPRLWFLNQTVDCRVYQKLSTADILKQLFNDVGLADVSIVPAGSAREYTVQFNESDLTFATRLMEEEGYFYFFEHTAAAHKLIIADRNATFSDIPGATLHLRGESDGTFITDWSRASRTVRGMMKLRDYDPEKPDTALAGQRATTLKTAGHPARDDFRWPANTFESETVTNRAQWEMEAAEAQAALFDGSSHFGKLVPGGKFKLQSRPASPYDDTYAVRAVSHHATDESWLSQGATASYSNQFTCFPTKVPWRQPFATPRPRMEGIHTALVLGPQHGKEAEIKSQDGEEIHTDKFGRVKVRFYWDHREEATGGQATWARVVQPWAGKGWGAQFIPRVGTEVAVAFVDGDPDRPIIIGGLYNGRDTPIYSDTEKTKSGFRSRSTLKGSTAHFNEFTFDDKKDGELVFLHAQKDLTTTVEHDQTLTVDNCRIVTVKQDETVDIQNNQTIKVKQDQSITVTDGNRSVKISKGNDTLGVAMGNIAIKADMGKIEVEAMQSITLTVGQNPLKLDQQGLTVSALMVKFTAQTMLQAGSPMTKVSGDGVLTLQGGLIKLN